MTQPTQETRLIHCYDMVSFVTEIEKAVKQGFSLDLKKNEHYPVVLGYQYICTMVKDTEKEVKNPQKEVLTIKVDASEVQAAVAKAVEEVKTLLEASELEKAVQSTTEELQAAVGAPKKAPKKAAGRPAKGK